MKKRVNTGIISVMMSMLLLFGSNALAASNKPTILKPCKQCHEVEKNYLRGKLKSVSRKAKTIQVFMGPATWQVTFDQNTSLDGAKAVHKIGKMKEIGIQFEQKGKVLVAKSIEVKQPAEIDPKLIISVEEMQRLVAMGPEKGNFMLYDARPGKFFLEGHIKGAVSNYDALFEKNLNKLPKDKSKLLVFYC